jgi:SAM-dependent methyltransferase
VPNAPRDAWASGDAYEQYVGRWSRLVAREFLSWLAVAPNAAWLDVGCGTGALTEEILNATAPASIHSIDRSIPYTQFARRRVPDPRVTFSVADAEALALRAESVDAVVSALALNFITRPSVALDEVARVTRTGGVVAVYVWDYAGQMQLMRYFWDAALTMDSHVAELDEAGRFPMCNRPALETLFRTAGFADVETRAIDVPTVFRDFDDYWTPFLGGQGPAPGYTMHLTEERRVELRERIRAALPVARDGSISLIARAWAVRGTRR